MKKFLVFTVIIISIIIFFGFAFNIIGIKEHFGENIFYVGDPEYAIKKHIESEYQEIIDEYNKNYKNQRLSFFNFLTDTIEQSYTFLKEKEKQLNFSFNELKNFYKSKISMAKSNEEFNYLIFEMQSVLNDPNLRVTGIMKDIKTLPISIGVQGESLYIISFNINYFLKNSVSFDKIEGLKIKSIDGNDALEIYEKVQNVTFYKNLSSQDFKNIFFASYYNYFRKNEGFTELILTDGEQDYSMNVMFTPYEENYNMGNFITEEREDIKGIESKIIGENVGYLKIDSFDFGSFQETLSNEMKKIEFTDILIMDLRNISGENMLNLKYLFSFFEPNSIFSYSKQNVNHHLSVISNRPLEEKEGLIPIKSLTNSQKYDKELVFIVDETHNNNKNLMISFFKNKDYAHFIGENYILHSSESLNIETPWGYTFLMPYLQYYDQDKNLIEGINFKVDVVIPFVNIQAVGEGFYLETAFNYALALIK
jgi:hypothetical protein